jgi:uncharacterized membrane protein
MLNKYIYVNHLRTGKLYILVGITLPLAVSTIVLALAAGNLVFAGVFVVASGSWSAFALYLARKLSRRNETDKAHRIMEETPPHRRRNRFFKISSLLILIVAIAMLIMVIIYSRPLYFALAALWWILVNGSEFVFVSVITGE